MRYILPITVVLSALSFVAAGLGAFMWWHMVASEPPLLSNTWRATASTAEIIASASDIESLRRICGPMAEVHDRMLHTTQAMADQTLEFTSGFILAHIVGGVSLGIVFGFIYLTLKRLHASHPALFK